MTRKKLTIEQFVERAQVHHGDTYDYQLVEYQGNKVHVDIVCPVHGIFNQRPDHHMAGQGCPTCVREARLGGYTEELFRTKPHIKDQPGVIYFIKMEDEGEMFWKIGITSRSVEERFAAKSDKASYEIEVLAISNTTLYNAYSLEQEILRNYSHKKYLPQNHFHGWTECMMLEEAELSQVIGLLLAE